jgi:hypothetical protein
LVKKPTRPVARVAPKAEALATTAIGLLPATVGYEVYNPSDDSVSPMDVIGWLISDVDGTVTTIPLTTEGVIQEGWNLRYRSFGAPVYDKSKEQSNADEAT